MRAPKDYHLYYEDRLVRRFRNPNTRHTIMHGKRVAEDGPITQQEAQVYVKGGVTPCVKYLRQTRGLELRKCLDLLNSARGKGRYYNTPEM